MRSQIRLKKLPGMRKIHLHAPAAAVLHYNLLFCRDLSYILIRLSFCLASSSARHLRWASAVFCDTVGPRCSHWAVNVIRSPENNR